ncbi:MAG: hypothetical protein GY765_13390, partial [bacterium]|nr:hypothetical protein [bacterium]
YLYPALAVAYFVTGKASSFFIFSHTMTRKDFLILYPFWWGLVAVVEMAPYLALLDIPAFLKRIGKFKPGEKWLLRLDILKIAVAAFFILYTGIRIYYDTSTMRVTSNQVTVADLPEELNGLSISFVGDIHENRYTRNSKTLRLLKSLENGNDHLILCSGDLVTRGTHFLPKILKTMGKAKARIAAVSCMGDHDLWSASEAIPRGLRNGGWSFLENAHSVFHYKGRHILVTGVTHVYSSRIKPADLEKLLAEAPRADLKILLVHQPSEFVVEAAGRHGYDLFLAGHTHGGQIVVHFFGIPITASQRETKYYRGAYRVGKMQVVVTNGMGFTLAPIRYHAPAEINRITVGKGTSDGT